MTDPLFLAEFGNVAIGDAIELTGAEARHAVRVKRIKVGETVLIADGNGNLARGRVTHTEPTSLRMEVADVTRPKESPYEVVAVQALAKGDRSELAVAMLTELGATSILAWQANRCVVRWQGERGAKALRRWQATAREAAKQSRRPLIPQVSAADTQAVAQAISSADLALVLHEGSPHHIGKEVLPSTGRIVVIVGPEGGISPGELKTFTDAGAHAVAISDGVLRTSTAGAIALGQLGVLANRGSGPA